MPLDNSWPMNGGRKCNIHSGLPFTFSVDPEAIDRKQTLHRKTITAQQPLDGEFRKMRSLKQRMVMGGRENGEMLVKGLNISFIQVE